MGAYLSGPHGVFQFPTVRDLVGQDIQIEGSIGERLFGLAEQLVDIIELNHRDLIE